MGCSDSSVKDLENPITIWLEPNIDKIENSKQLKLKLNSLNIKIITNLNKAIKHLKKTKYKQVKLILNEEMHSKFIQKCKENDMNFLRKVFVHKTTEEGKIIFDKKIIILIILIILLIKNIQFIKGNY